MRFPSFAKLSLNYRPKSNGTFQGWLLHVHRRTPRLSIETCSHNRIWNSREAVVDLIVLLCVKYTRHFLHWHLLIFLLELFTDLVSVAAPVFFTTSEESSILPVSSVIPYGAVIPESSRLLLSTSRPMVTTSCRKVRSTTESPRVSLGFGIVTLPVPVWTCTSVN